MNPQLAPSSAACLRKRLVKGFKEAFRLSKDARPCSGGLGWLLTGKMKKINPAKELL
jgi:hypothetical protein